MINKTAPFVCFMNILKKNGLFTVFVKSGSVIIFFCYNLVANFARVYESTLMTAHINVLVDSRTFKYSLLF